jgi:hypothetical protein
VVSRFSVLQPLMVSAVLILSTLTTVLTQPYLSRHENTLEITSLLLLLLQNAVCVSFGWSAREDTEAAAALSFIVNSVFTVFVLLFIVRKSRIVSRVVSCLLFRQTRGAASGGSDYIRMKSPVS